MGVSRLRYASLAARAAANYFLGRPLCISFEVTYCCNARCKHCNRGGTVEEERATPERYGELCRELKPLVAQLSGGEPLLRNDLEQITEALRVPHAAPYIVVLTNGALLNMQRYRSLRQAGADAFSISLDYPDERHDGFRGIPGLFRRVEAFISNLPREERGLITLCCVVQSDNLRDLVQMAELSRQWDVKLNFSAYNHLRTNDKNYLLSAEQVDEFNSIVTRLLAFRQRHGVIRTSGYVFERMKEFFSRGHMPACRTGTRFFNVNPSGTLSPCGLITTDYRSQRELNNGFSKTNRCAHCYTSIRANSEKPARHLLKDNITAL